MSTKPKYMSKHPCTRCGAGYGECAQGWTMSLMCCTSCAHPTRFEPNPWTAEDLSEMQAENDRRARTARP